ncbi:MAG TPA: J domain-containing protein [Solirubrobacteraceae bacterium]|nr:J domain-containing protein [Solirubrobacteraceae bacterium]
MDPFAVLDLPQDASPEQAGAAYRRLAKRWHPDRAGAGAAGRMAEINAAYDLLRSGEWQRRRRTGAGATRAAGAAARRPAGWWLPSAVRRALGGELLGALEPDEAVVLVTPAATWASPQTLLALTDRRLLWLLDDAPTHRVRSLRLAAVAGVETRLRRPLRRVAALRVQVRGGRRLEFSELRPATAAALARRLASADARTAPAVS